MKTLITVCLTAVIVVTILNNRERRLRQEIAQMLRVIAFYKGLTENAD